MFYFFFVKVAPLIGKMNLFRLTDRPEIQHIDYRQTEFSYFILSMDEITP